MMVCSLPRSLLVLGLGESGQAAARLAAAGGARVRVSDRRSEGELAAVAAAMPAGVDCVFGGHPETVLDGVEMVVVSPGVAADAAILERARARSIEVVSEVEYAWRHRPQATLVAVTGSNGKSTVTSLTAEMLRAGGLAAVAGGNLGPAASALVLAGGWEAWVLEVSSFQTEIFNCLRPRVAMLLNLSQDHLERHPDMAAYLAAKRRLFACQEASDVAVLNADDPASAATPCRARRALFSLRQPADACLRDGSIVLDETPLVAVDELGLSGLHNQANAMASALAAAALGVGAEAMAATLRSFSGLAHRHRRVHEAAGVVWVDDSKATNVGATLAALEGYPPASVHLILGGQAKGQDFTPLRAAVSRAVVHGYLIGVDAEHIAQALADTAPLEHCDTLEEAVSRSRSQARAGQWVLLSPACASFDQFSSYVERGECFAALARSSQGAPCP